MGVIVRPDDLASIMAEVYARLDAIERTSGPMHDFAIRDANGILRVAGGNLPALGISPAQEGIRVVDAFGNPIFDTLGLTNVMQPIGTCHPSFPSGGFTSTAVTEYNSANSHATFSVARPQTVLTLCSMAFSLPSGGGIAPFEFGLGLDQTTALDSDATAGFMSSYMAYSGSTLSVPTTLFMVKQVAAGTHAIYFLGANMTGVTVSDFGGGLMKVFQLGS